MIYILLDMILSYKSLKRTFERSCMKKKLTIIGAGVSGLYLAYLLEDKYEITILEARDRVGGRIFSLNANDMGPSWIWSHHKAILELVSTLGLELFSQYTSGYSLYDTKDKVEMFHPQPTAPSARMKGTLSKLIDTLNARLKSTVIILNEEVLSVQDGDGVIVKSKNNSYESDFLISTLPPRLTAQLAFNPGLPASLKKKMLSLHTWMGNSAKCVVEFKSPVWRENSLSGFVFSNIGPLGEIHDASEGDKYALFGFVSANADMSQFETNVKAQMIRLFAINEDDILNVYLVDWKQEKFSSVAEDRVPMSIHPDYGVDTSSYSKKIFFSSTEFSFNEGGYIEGAIQRAKEIFLTLS